LVKYTSFFGSAITTPFHHYDMTNLVLYVNGVQHPAEPLTMDCSSPFGTTRTYETLFSSPGIHHDDRAHMITLQMFTQGFYVLGFDFTPDREAEEEHISLPRQGNMRIEVCFKNNYQNQLPAYLCCISWTR
jgi:hypothetical protein